MAPARPPHGVADDQKTVQLFSLRPARFPIGHSADLVVIESRSLRITAKIHISCAPHQRWHPVVAINWNPCPSHVTDFSRKLLNQLIPLRTTENNVPITSKMSKPAF